MYTLLVRAVPNRKDGDGDAGLGENRAGACVAMWQANVLWRGVYKEGMSAGCGCGCGSFCCWKEETERRKLLFEKGIVRHTLSNLTTTHRRNS